MHVFGVLYITQVYGNRKGSTAFNATPLPQNRGLWAAFLVACLLGFLLGSVSIHAQSTQRSKQEPWTHPST